MIKNVSQHAFEETLLDGVVIDIGEHKRVFSTALAALGCQVRGFEPGTIFDSYEDIPNITSHNKAVVNGDQTGSVFYFDYGFDGEGNSLLKHTQAFEEGKVSANRKLQHEIVSESIGIDDILDQFDKVSILKIDVEGAEYKMLDSVKPELLRKCQQITVEFHSSRGEVYDSPLTLEMDQQVIDRLINIGFNLVYESPDHLNCLFIRDGLEYSFDKLSIIVSVLNSHELVRRQLIYLNGVLDADCELILLDDGSIPALRDVVDSVQKNYDFRLIETGNFEKWTQPAARNLGAREAKYERLLFFDIDHFLTRQIIEYAKVDEIDRMFFQRLPGILDENGVITPVDAKLDRNVHVNSFMIRKSLFNKVGGYDERFCGQYGHDDTDLNRRLQGLNIQQAVRGVGYTLNGTGENEEGKLHDLKRLGRIGIYTALIGGRGALNDQGFVAIGNRYNAYTNRPSYQHPQWVVTIVASESGRDRENPARFAKQFKFHPEKYSKGEIRIWADANVSLTEKMKEVLEDEMTRYDLFFFKHYTRDCVYDEAIEVITSGRDSAEIVESQMKRYRDEGFPEHFGLPECNVIVSRETPEVRAFFELWEKEVESGSVRDQLSVSYALWKTKPNYVISEKDSEDGKRKLEYRKVYSHGIENKIAMSPKPKLLILIPVHHPADEFLMTLIDLIFYLSSEYAILVRPHTGGAYLHSKYNELLGGGGGLREIDFKPFSDSQDEIYRCYDYIITLENDMVVRGEQIEKLIQTMNENNIDVISGIYVASDGQTFCHLIEDAKNPGHAIRTREIPVGLQKTWDIPLGATIFRKGVIERTEYPWFAPSVIVSKDETGLPLAIEFTGQDLGLSHKLRDAGINRWIDPSIRYGHVKTHVLYPGDENKKYNAVLDDVYDKIRESAPETAEMILTMRKPV